MHLPKTFLFLLLASLTTTLPNCAQSVTVTALHAAPQPGMRVRLADPGSSVVEASSSLKGYSLVVTDGFGAPISGASVALLLPEKGPSGFFLDGARSAVASTDAGGMAKFADLHWSSILGVAQVHVTVLHNEQHLTAVIEQTVVDHADLAAAQAKSGLASIVSADDSAQFSRQPGTPMSLASVRSGATPGQSPTVQPIAQPATPDSIADTSKQPPSVSVVNQSQVTTGGSRSGFNKKWLVVAAVAVGATAGIAVAMAGHGGAAATSSPTAGLTIGAPSISVGH